METTCNYETTKEYESNLEICGYDDTLKKIKDVAYKKLYDSEHKQILKLQKRISTIEYISPLSESVVFPILTKMTNIPYQHFVSLSPEHAAVISVYIQSLLRKVFNEKDYDVLFNLLNCYPFHKPRIHSNYRIKNISKFIELQHDTKNFFGFNTVVLPNKAMSYFIGKTSRVDFVDILTGKHIKGIKISDLELCMLKFFTMYFSGQLKDKIDKMAKLMDADF